MYTWTLLYLFQNLGFLKLATNTRQSLNKTLLSVLFRWNDLKQAELNYQDLKRLVFSCV